MSFVLALALAGPLVSAQQVTRNPVPGVANFARLETTVACAGATTPEAMPSIKQMGFVSVINLREASENGANVDAEAAAAKAAGLKYFHVPFNGSTPSPQAIEQFLDAITSAGSEPAFIHCSGGNRAAAMWLAKRLCGQGKVSSASRTGALLRASRHPAGSPRYSRGTGHKTGKLAPSARPDRR